MGYKTKSMIRATSGAYASGNVDNMYDSAAFLKTNVTEFGKSLGKIAGPIIKEKIKKKKEKEAKEKAEKDPNNNSPLKNEGKVLVAGSEENYAGSADFIKKTINDKNELDSPIDVKPEDEKSTFEKTEEIVRSLSGVTMVGDGFSKAMLRKNKYKR